MIKGPYRLLDACEMFEIIQRVNFSSIPLDCTFEIRYDCEVLKVYLVYGIAFRIARFARPHSALMLI